MPGSQAPSILRISEHEPEEFFDVEKLFGRIEGFVRQRQNKQPVIITIETPGKGAMGIGIGARQGLCLHHMPEDNEPPYLASINETENSDDTVDYYLFGNHHTEVETRHIIGIAPALEAVGEFCRTGALSGAISWTEV